MQNGDSRVEVGAADRARKWRRLGAAAVATLVLALLAGEPWNRNDEPSGEQATTTVMPTRRADFGAYRATAAARLVADWAAASDAGGGPFIIIDKRAAAIYVFDADARVRGSAPVLLGSAIGDETVPGIGDKPLDRVLAEEKTTPAGRFVGEPGHNARGEDVIWIDYEAAVSMHRVITFNPEERRLERLMSPTIDDNRISYGCVNVPAEFYDSYVRPAYAKRNAIVYVLPDVKPLVDVFDTTKAHFMPLLAERLHS